jgi:hypothetical protein
VDRAYQPARDLLAGLTNRRMDGGDDDIHLAQDLVREVEASIGADVDLEPFEEANPPRVHLADGEDLLMTLRHARGVEALGRP